MDDFRVGSVSSPDPYGRRGLDESVRRRREKRHDRQDGEQEDEAADEFQVSDVEGQPAELPGPVEDYYVPAEAAEEEPE